VGFEVTGVTEGDTVLDLKALLGFLCPRSDMVNLDPLRRAALATAHTIPLQYGCPPPYMDSATSLFAAWCSYPYWVIHSLARIAHASQRTIAGLLLRLEGLATERAVTKVVLPHGISRSLSAFTQYAPMVDVKAASAAKTATARLKQDAAYLATFRVHLGETSTKSGRHLPMCIPIASSA